MQEFSDMTPLNVISGRISAQFCFFERETEKRVFLKKIVLISDNRVKQ